MPDQPMPDQPIPDQPPTADQAAAPAVSDTQWRELAWALARTQIATAWRIKDRVSGQPTSWDRQWYNHVEASYAHVQWLELQVPPEARHDLRQLLTSIGVPFTEAGNFFVPHHQDGPTAEH